MGVADDERMRGDRADESSYSRIPLSAARHIQTTLIYLELVPSPTVSFATIPQDVHQTLHSIVALTPDSVSGSVEVTGQLASSVLTSTNLSSASTAMPEHSSII